MFDQVQRARPAAALDWSKLVVIYARLAVASSMKASALPQNEDRKDKPGDDDGDALKPASLTSRR